MDEDKVLAWFIKQKESEEIEEVTEKMFFELVDENPFLVVLFCEWPWFTSDLETREKKLEKNQRVSATFT